LLQLPYNINEADGAITTWQNKQGARETFD
jgi:hypothetical protein